MRHLDRIRSLLFVPANSAAKLAKSREIDADALVLDWEDAVSPDQKSVARLMTADFLKCYENLSKPILIRINSVGTSFYEDDVVALGGCSCDGVLVAKCQSVKDMESVDTALTRSREREKCSMVPMVESARALLQCHAIVSYSPRVAAVAFGAEDFSADVGISRTAGELELLYARSLLVTTARAVACQAIDSPCLEYRDLEQVRSTALHARNLGFAGKLAIHPAQVPILNEVFSPSESEISEARLVLESFESRGGLTAIGGRMVDQAVLRRARQILRQAVQVDSKEVRPES